MKSEPAFREDFSCGGVVIDPSTNSVLLIQVENLAKSVVWTFPKGHPEQGESEHAAALREVWEETGWDCEITKPLLDVDYVFVHENVKTHKVVRWFLMKPLKKTGEFDPREIAGCEWVALSKARQRISYESDQKLLAAVGY